MCFFKQTVDNIITILHNVQPHQCMLRNMYISLSEEGGETTTSILPIYDPNTHKTYFPLV